MLNIPTPNDLGKIVTTDGNGEYSGNVVASSETGNPAHDLIVNHGTAIIGQINFAWSPLLNAGLGIRTVRLFPIGTKVRYVVNPEDATQGASQLANIADTVAAAPVQSSVVYRHANETKISKDDGLIVSDEPIKLICAIVDGGSLTSLRAEAN